MTSNTPIYPHGNVEEIAEDIFMLRGSIKMNPLLRITRNMGIIRNGDELSLINPVRVSAKVEAQIAKLGRDQTCCSTRVLSWSGRSLLCRKVWRADVGAARWHHLHNSQNRQRT